MISSFECEAQCFSCFFIDNFVMYEKCGGTIIKYYFGGRCKFDNFEYLKSKCINWQERPSEQLLYFAEYNEKHIIREATDWEVQQCKWNY